MVSFLFGSKGGETIKSIQGEYGVTLKVDPNTDANGERRVAVYGELVAAMQSIVHLLLT